MTMNEPAFVPPYLTLKEAAEYLERATGKAWNPSMLMGFCAQQNIPVNAAVPRDARAVQCEITNYVPELTIRPVKLPPLTIKGRTHAHYWLATWRMAVAYPETIAHVWQTGRGEVAHGVPTARDHEPCMVLFVNDKHEPVTHEVTAEDLRVQRDTLRVIRDRWSETQALPAARPATPAPSASAPAAALPEPVAAPAEAVAVPGAGRPPTVRQAIAPYVAKLMRERPNYTAEELHRRMRRDAGGDDSPFSRLVQGGGLFCVDSGRPCGLSTVRNALTDYRKTNRKRSSSTVEAVEAPSNP